MKIVVDTHIVFSAMLDVNSRSGNVLVNAKNLHLYSSYHLKTEIRHLQKNLLKLTGMTVEDLIALEKVATRNIMLIDEAQWPHDLVLKTDALLAHIDPKDVPFVALTCYLNAKLWTGDMKLYNGLKANNFTNVMNSAEIFLMLDKLNQGSTN